jgi:hypothetical protein
LFFNTYVYTSSEVGSDLFVAHSNLILSSILSYKSYAKLRSLSRAAYCIDVTMESVLKNFFDAVTKEAECEICWETKTKFLLLCGHMFCGDCLQKVRYI